MRASYWQQRERAVTHVFNGFTLWGLALVAVGLLLRWRTARYDLKDKVLSSAFQTVRGKRSSDNPTALDEELRDITSQVSMTGKATKAARKVAGHFVAQLAGLIALGLLLLGAVLMAYGMFAK
jgi:hypothetical protein